MAIGARKREWEGTGHTMEGKDRGEFLLLLGFKKKSLPAVPAVSTLHHCIPFGSTPAKMYASESRKQLPVVNQGRLDLILVQV